MRVKEELGKMASLASEEEAEEKEKIFIDPILTVFAVLPSVVFSMRSMGSVNNLPFSFLLSFCLFSFLS